MTVKVDAEVSDHEDKSIKPRCFLDVTLDGEAAGRIVVELWPEGAEKTCENFRCLCTGEKSLATKPLHYRGSPIHRVVKGFMIQGGDFTSGNGTGGESIYGGSFADEVLTRKHTEPYLLSMANRGPNTNGSQFFITCKPTPHLDGKHVVFGRVLSGKEIVKKIEALDVDDKHRPTKTVAISNCGELIKTQKKKKKKKRSSDKESGDSSNAEDRKAKKEKKQKKKAEEKAGTTEIAAENGKKNEPEVFCTVRPDELPEEPKQGFLYRRSGRTPDPEEKNGDDIAKVDASKSPNRDPSPGVPQRSGITRYDGPSREEQYSRSRERRSTAGHVIKGRGFCRYRTPPRSRSRSRERDRREATPPHWRREMDRVISFDEYKRRKEKYGSPEPPPMRQPFVREGAQTAGDRRLSENGGRAPRDGAERPDRARAGRSERDREERGGRDRAERGGRDDRREEVPERIVRLGSTDAAEKTRRNRGEERESVAEALAREKKKRKQKEDTESEEEEEQEVTKKKKGKKDKKKRKKKADTSSESESEEEVVKKSKKKKKKVKHDTSSEDEEPNKKKKAKKQASSSEEDEPKKKDKKKKKKSKKEASSESEEEVEKKRKRKKASPTEAKKKPARDPTPEAPQLKEKAKRIKALESRREHLEQEAEYKSEAKEDTTALSLIAKAIEYEKKASQSPSDKEVIDEEELFQPSPPRRVVSRDEEAKSPERIVTPAKRRSPSPRTRSPAKRRSPSPRRRSPERSQRRRSPAKRRSPSPRRRSPARRSSPKRRSPPRSRKRTPSPRRPRRRRDESTSPILWRSRSRSSGGKKKRRRSHSKNSSSSN